MDSHSSLVFDKVAINDLMRTVIGRLRKQKITIPDIIAQLNANGIAISRAKFNDWFMTRSERDATAPIAVLHAVIDVLYALQPHIMTATELFSLLIATRMPINLIHAYAPYFPKEEWNKVLGLYGIHHNLWDDAIIGQEKVIQQAYWDLLTGKCQIIVGAPGIGKTMIAGELMRQYQLFKGNPIVKINLMNVQSFTTLQTLMLKQFGIQPNDYQPIKTQLNNYIVRHNPIILFDDFKETASFTITQWLNHLHTNFTPFMWLITMRKMPEVITPIPVQITTIAPLPYEKNDSPAWMLAKRCLLKSGMFAPQKELLQVITQMTQGNPNAIQLLVNDLQMTNFVYSPDHNIDSFVHLDSTARTLLELMTVLHVPFSEHVIRMLAPVICQTSVAKIEESIKILKNKGYLLVIEDTLATYFLLQRTIFTQITATLLPVKRIHYLQSLFDGLCDGFTIDMKFPHNLLKFQSDLPLLLQLATLMLQVGMVDACALLCCLCSEIAIEVGDTADIVQIMEQCVRMLPNQSTTYIEMQLVLGKLYSERGLTFNAVNCFMQVRASELLRTNDYFRARVAVIQALGYMVRDVNLQPTDFDFLCQELEFAIDYCSIHQRIMWQSRAHHCLAYLYLFAGNVSVAHKHSAAALQLISMPNKTNEANDFYAHILRLHAVTLSLMGDYTLARNQLKQALVEYQQTFRSIEILQTYMRLAMNELFARDIQAVTNYLYITLQEIHKTGNAKSVLYCIDIYIILLCVQGNTTHAQQLLYRANGFRIERGVSRGAVFDQIIAQYFPQSAHQTIIKATVEPNQSLSDVLSQITAELNARIDN